MNIWTRSVARPNAGDSPFPYAPTVGKVRRLAAGERKEKKKKKDVREKEREKCH